MTRLSSALSKPHPALVSVITAGDGETAAICDAIALNVVAVEVESLHR